MKILVLGGTAMAVKIADNLNAEVIYSLAGLTSNPTVPNSATIISGGFSGVDGLVRFLQSNSINCVIDATHPYAINIKNNAKEACNRINIKLVAYTRTLWQKSNYKDWVEYESVDDIVEDISAIDGDIFVALGAKDIGKFRGLSGRVVARMVVDKKIDGIVSIIDKGLFSQSGEEDLFNTYAFKAMVCKNSGTENGRIKIDIAKKKGIPIYMLKCPVVKFENSFLDMKDLIDFIQLI